jgi:excinuclease ABC subunit A
VAASPLNVRPRGTITIRGAREHNLKDVSLDLPRDSLVVITGLSGSGKSSLAFDTLYAEGQRRYVESLSAYARQFLGQMDKPDVDGIEGLSPAISIDQKTTSKNPRSTVATVTEIYDYFRLLFARIGIPHCPECGRVIGAQTPEQIVDRLLDLPEGTRFLVLAPLVRDRKGEHRTLFESLRAEGFTRVLVDGEQRTLDEPIVLEKTYKHTIHAVVDRLVMRADLRRRLADSVETALRLAEGTLEVRTAPREGEGFEETMLFSEHFACEYDGTSIPEIAPRSFSFNSPHGACEACTGLGFLKEVDPELVVPDPKKAVGEGAIAPWAGSSSGYYDAMLEAASRHWGIDLWTPWEQLPPEHQEILLRGGGRERLPVTFENARGRPVVHYLRFEGVVSNLARRHRDTESDNSRERIEEYMSLVPCRACGGKRLKPSSLAVTVHDRSVADLTELTVSDVLAFLRRLELTHTEELIAGRVVKELLARLRFLDDVGVGYLTLDRAAATLSGGEAQRIRLATQIGSSLVGVLYILDEPSIGLHPRDNRKLITTLERLRDIGNTVLVVEHDEETMRAADHVVDMGPGAGELGGEVVAEGTVDDIMATPGSVTGAFLSGRRGVAIPEDRREPSGWLTVRGAREHNLRDIDVRFPLGVFCAVTGVSGSGKSTLVNEILHKALAQKLMRARTRPGRHAGIEGIEALDKVIQIDQSPIGRTPRSNPATYTSLFDTIRDLYSQTPEAKVRGYKPGRFSFNVKGGRCEHCAGDGQIKMEMFFLPDVYVPCEVCKGRRYNRETLEVMFKTKSIADVLEMPVEEAVDVFANIPKIARRLRTLQDVGLGYIRLGQPATTLSGGEAQRVKLAAELSKVATGRTMYILDEPTTGLHFADVEHLLVVLQRLVGAGNTVVVIEHNLDVVKTADWVIDLGPEGGSGGGEILAEGTPEEIAATAGSYTGAHIAGMLGVERPEGRHAREPAATAA